MSGQPRPVITFSPAAKMPLHDPYRSKLERLRRRVLTEAGTLDARTRTGAAANSASAPLADYVAKVHHQAADVTDADVAALREHLSEDQIFELTVAAATGAGLQRIDRVLALLEAVS